MKKEEDAIKKVPKKSVKETITLMMRKKWLTNTTQLVLIILILVASFLAINLYAQSKDLPEIDVTENKVYTISDASKEVIKNIKEDVKIYVYGYEEDDLLVGFVKKYTKLNDHITYEILTEKDNLAKVQEFGLSEDYRIIVLETANSTKTIDTSYEFYSYDEMGNQVDLTEQTLTNSLLAITTENKPKVYFTTGHEEYDLTTNLGLLNRYLENEAYDAQTVNLLTTGAVPEDCNLLAIMAPIKDFVEPEVNAVLDYINKGGNLIITSEVGNLEETYPNLTRVYDAYGVVMENKGYIYETDSARTASGYPYILMPEISSSNSITSDIYAKNGQMLLVLSGRLTFKSDEELTALGVTKEDLLTSTDKSIFIKDLNTSPEDAANSSEIGKSTIAALVTKTVSPAVEASEGVEAKDAVESKLMIMANTSFILDARAQELDSNYPISTYGNNKDFMLNAIADLTVRENTLKIRKDMSTATYQPTQQEYVVVLIIIFAVPVLIIIAGIAVGIIRKRMK